MIDLATYERTLFVLFDAPGHEGNSWPTSDTPDENLVLQPCFELGAYRFPVAGYYHNAVDQTEAELPPFAESYVAICRYNYLTSTVPITRPHFEFLQSMQQTQNIDVSLKRLADQLEVSEEKIRQSWKFNLRERWIENRFFVDRTTLE
jgi:hypothetical protein